ncbi:EthD domain-containing protein [Arthrobacter globiformis]|uniref:EthD domain-containing protein n=1 Tax=Arthrobacter globiformis TaxID=1665 RepID=A0A328HFS4_ARTGO|nr:hypothetical protein DBZ45_18460 [Arthrobacter globiformis]
MADPPCSLGSGRSRGAGLRSEPLCSSTRWGNRPYAGLGEVWFETREAAAAGRQSPEWSAVVADAREFMDMPTIVVAWAEEHRASPKRSESG